MVSRAIGIQYLGITSGGNAVPPWTDGFSFGAEAPDRYLLAIISHGSNVRTFGAVTIGGEVAPPLVKIDGINRSIGIFMALKPTGASGNVVTNASSSNSHCCALYRLAGPINTTPLETYASASPQSNDFTIASGGVLIVGQSRNIDLGLVGVTKDGFINVSTNVGLGVGSLAVRNEGSPRTASVTGASSVAAMVGVSLGLAS